MSSQMKCTFVAVHQIGPHAVELEAAMLLQAPRKLRAEALGVAANYAPWRLHAIMLPTASTQLVRSQEKCANLWVQSALPPCA